MNFQERRDHVSSIIQHGKNFRKTSKTDFMTSYVEHRENFEAEDIYSSAGSTRILVIFTAGQSGTPQRQAFDFYLSKDIKTGIHTISKDSNNPFIEITYSEFDPTQAAPNNNYSYVASAGALNLFVNAEERKYSGSLEAVFEDRNGKSFTSDGSFSFSLAL